MPFLEELKSRAANLKRDTLALVFAARHAATPWYAKLLVAAIVAYALSPIDLIPDFIPVLGYLDDLILLPMGIALAIRIIPAAVMAECRARAATEIADGGASGRIAAVVIVLVWVGLMLLCGLWLYRLLAPAGSAMG